MKNGRMAELVDAFKLHLVLAMLMYPQILIDLQQKSLEKWIFLYYHLYFRLLHEANMMEKVLSIPFYKKLGRARYYSGCQSYA